MDATMTIVLFMVCATASGLQASELSDEEQTVLFATFGQYKNELAAEVVAMYKGTDHEANDVVAPLVSRRTNKRLLRTVKRDWDNERACKILAQRGADALPLLIASLDGADDDFRYDLFTIMSEIQDPRRDAVFLKELEKEFDNLNAPIVPGGEFAPSSVAEAIMHAAASQGIQTLVPVLKQFAAREDVKDGLRGEARNALARMGELDLSSVSDPDFESDAATKSAKTQPQMEMLDALIKYQRVALPRRVETIDSGADGSVLLRGTAADGQWEVRFGAARSGRVPLYCYWIPKDSNCRSIDTGVLEQSRGQWTIVMWESALSINWDLGDGANNVEQIRN